MTPRNLSALKGAAAVAEAVNLIGNDREKTDHDMAKIIVENELAVRDLVRFALKRLAKA